MLLPASDDGETPALGPEEAADELLARMLEYRRYREAAARFREMFAAGEGFHFRSAPLPRELRRVSLDAARPVYRPERLAEAIGGLLRMPSAPDTSHMRPTVSLERRLDVLRELLTGPGEVDFDTAFGEEDRLTQAVTIFALLEMHKRGDASWEQDGLFGPITIRAVEAADGDERMSA